MTPCFVLRLAATYDSLSIEVYGEALVHVLIHRYMLVLVPYMLYMRLIPIKLTTSSSPISISTPRILAHAYGHPCHRP